MKQANEDWKVGIPLNASQEIINISNFGTSLLRAQDTIKVKTLLYSALSYEHLIRQLFCLLATDKNIRDF